MRAALQREASHDSHVSVARLYVDVTRALQLLHERVANCE